jgi:hypothetical protein
MQKNQVNRYTKIIHQQHYSHKYMSLKKIFITFIMFFSLLGLSGSTFAKESKNMPEVLKQVDANIQAALDAIPAGNSEQVGVLIKVAHENAAELSANYKFEFERDKALGKLKKARDSAKKSDLPTTEQDLKVAKESFLNLYKYL